jgi:hypothetical protein
MTNAPSGFGMVAAADAGRAGRLPFANAPFVLVVISLISILLLLAGSG